MIKSFKYILLTLLFPCIWQVEAAPLKVFVLAGQSNMKALAGRASSLPVDSPFLGPQPGVLYFDGVDAWNTYDVGTNSLVTTFGPEITFAQTMRDFYGEDIGIVKQAVGGTDLYNNWNPITVGNQFEAFRDKVLAAQANREIEIVGMLWMQGEADAASNLYANVYAGNLAALVQTCRSTFNSSNMVFVAGRINPPEVDFPYTDTVRTALENCAEPLYSWINCDGLSKTAADLHYDPDGLIDMGYVFANAIKAFDGVYDAVPVTVAESYDVDPGATLEILTPGVLANDSDPENLPLSASLISDVSNGTLILNPDGSFSYTPNAGAPLIDSFTYAANDGTDDGNIVTVEITINPVPITKEWVELTFDDFETDFGNYTDGGEDCTYSTDPAVAYSGVGSARLQDDMAQPDSSFFLTTGIDVATPGYTEIQVEFWFLPSSVETGRGFGLQFWDGSAWQTVQTWTKGVEYIEEVYTAASTTISSSSYTLPADMKIRFISDVENNRDSHFFDDIRISAVGADGDGDGIDDSWEEAYFGGDAEAEGNPDQDPFTNLEEYIAGLDPTNASAYFAVADFTPAASPGGLIMQWESVSNRIYSVRWTGSLTNGFQVLQDNIHYPKNSYTDTTHNAESTGYYRLDVRLAE